MEIKFSKRYPDFSLVPYCVSLLEHHRERVFPSFLLYIALFLNELPAGSQVVYSGPWKGYSLLALNPFLESHRVILIENFWGRSKTKEEELPVLRESISKVSCAVKLIEEDFIEVWPTLSNVDFLLLDGPPSITNFEPFSKKFVYMMHDINQRLADPSWEPSLYLPYLCRADDRQQFKDIPDSKLHPYLKAYRDIDRESRLWKEYGPHAWLIGEKITA